jgi:hypothetical protein
MEHDDHTFSTDSAAGGLMSGRYVFLTDRSTVGTIRGMAIWDDLSITVARLAGQDPRPLTQWPQPGSRPDQAPPFRIGLAAWAATTAGDWGVQATLDPALGQAVRTPILPITVEP